MRRIGRVLGVCGGILALVAAGATADISNGDFSSGLTDWTVQEDLAGGTSHAVEATYASAVNVLRLSAETGAGGRGISAYTPEFVVGMFAPAGTDALRFDAAVELTGNDTPDWNNLEISVEVSYNDFVDTATWQITESGASWANRTLSLPNLDIAGQVLVTAKVVNSHDASKDVTANAYVDNFEFVPEACSIALLVAGSIGVFFKKRRARA